MPEVGAGLAINRSRVQIPAAPLSSATLGKFLTCTSVTKQYNLVPADGRWCLAAGKVTVGLESHWPRVTDISGSPPAGSRPRRGRWAPAYALLWSMDWMTLRFYVLSIGNHSIHHHYHHHHYHRMYVVCFCGNNEIFISWNQNIQEARLSVDIGNVHISLCNTADDIRFVMWPTWIKYVIDVNLPFTVLMWDVAVTI